MNTLSTTSNFSTLFNKINEIVVAINQLETTKGLTLLPREINETIAADGSYTLELPATFSGGLAIRVIPGDSMLVEYQIVSSGTWREWPLGAVTELAEDVLETQAATIKIRAFNAPGQVEIRYLAIL